MPDPNLATSPQIFAFTLARLNAEFEGDTYERIIACRGGLLMVFGSGRGLLLRAQGDDVGLQEIDPDHVAETVAKLDSRAQA